MFQIDFVGHQQNGHPFRPFHPGDEFLHGFYVLERLVISQAVHDHETLSVFYVQVAHACELFGASRVQYFEHARRAVHLDFLPVEVLDGRVVFLHETARDELNGQGALAHAARAQHDHFELAHRRTIDGRLLCAHIRYDRLLAAKIGISAK